MLGKLMKHELKATSRLLVPLYLILLCISILDRIILNFVNYNWMMKVISNILTTGFLFILVAIIVVTIVLIITRFYKNLVTDEGYLMFTLPVRTHQLINSKLIIAVFWMLISIGFIFGSLFIAFASTERMDIIIRTIRENYEELSTVFNGTLPVLTAEMILLCFVSLVTNLLMFYVSIAIGQLFNGRKLLGSFIAYIGIYTALQMIMLLMVGICILFNWDSLNSAKGYPQMLLPLFILILVACSAAFYFITNHILSKRLNLE